MNAAPGMALVRYDAMLVAIAEVKAVDEAKDIVDKAEAMRVYARQAKNREAEIDMAEIRIRAERRLGELLKEAKAEGHLLAGRPLENGISEEPFSNARLKDFGINKRLSSEAQQLADVPAAQFDKDIVAWRERTEKENGRVTAKLVRQETKREQRNLREVVLAAEQRALPDERYGVILADPPWCYEPYSRETGMDRAADNHYPTMGVGQIADLKVQDIAAPDCALFLWATIPMLEGAFFVLKTWGFEYKSHCVWVKTRIGTGYWFRQKHELLLVGTRGKIPAPAPGTQMQSAIEAAVGEHSVKPEIFYDLIEDYFPNLPRIELFARKARDGWDRWGNEAPAEAEVQGLLREQPGRAA